MIYYIFSDLFEGTDLSIYLMAFICIIGCWTVKTIRRKIGQYRYERKKRIEEKLRSDLEKRDMERLKKEQIAQIEMEDFWYE